MRSQKRFAWMVILFTGSITGLSSQHYADALSSTPKVALSSGAVIGLAANVPTANTTVNKYLGIPFAAPPVGDLRFALPQAALPWGNTSILNATSYANACFQANEDSSLLVEQSEDCLYLNIFAPSALPPSDSKGHAVMVWLHGGGLVAGSAAEANFDGTSFAANQDVIVVTINYRLNVFGFVNSPELPLAESNLGFYDQRLALTWVQQNIAAFNGDPEKVTIFGESSGSTCVSRLVETMADNTPFRAAILESGWADTAAVMNEYSVYGRNAWDTLVEGLNCTSSMNSTAEEFNCVKIVDATAIYDYLWNNTGVLFTAVNDNVTELSNPFQARATRSIATVPILTGTNANEGTLWTSAETLNELIVEFPQLAPFKDDMATSYVVGTPGLPNQWYANAAIDTDVEYKCPTSMIAAQTVQIGVPIWRYYFNTTFPNTEAASDYGYPVIDGYGAYHSAEIPIVWGTYVSENATTAEVQLSKVMQKAWADFAKDPYGRGPGWPRYDSPQDGSFLIAELGSSNGVQLGSWTVISNETIDGNCWIYEDLYKEFQGGTPWW